MLWSLIESAQVESPKFNVLQLLDASLLLCTWTQWMEDPDEPFDSGVLENRDMQNLHGLDMGTLDLEHSNLGDWQT